MVSYLSKLAPGHDDVDVAGCMPLLGPWSLRETLDALGSYRVYKHYVISNLIYLTRSITNRFAKRRAPYRLPWSERAMMQAPVASAVPEQHAGTRREC